MLNLNNLEKLHKSKKRVGRGGDSGGTSGKGHKGQKARSGAKISPAFEGGQMSISRRLPKRGFTNRFKRNVITVNLKDLEFKFDAGAIVNKETLQEAGLVKGKKKAYIKVLGNGELTKNLEVHANGFSKSSIELIKKAGGNTHIVQE